MIGGIPIGRPAQRGRSQSWWPLLSNRAASVHGADYVIEGGTKVTV